MFLYRMRDGLFDVPSVSLAVYRFRSPRPMISLMLATLMSIDVGLMALAVLQCFWFNEFGFFFWFFCNWNLSFDLILKNSIR